MWEQKLVQRYPLLGSSQDPESISMTVKGISMALLPFLSLLLSKWVSPELLAELINAVFGVVGAVLVVWGLIRKIKNRL